MNRLGLLTPDFSNALLFGKDNEPKDLVGGSVNGAHRLIPFSGIPKQPFHIEMAKRIQLLKDLPYDGTQPILLQGSLLDLQESDSKRPYLPPLDTSTDVFEWLSSIGKDGILCLLGLRKSIGTDPRGLLPPSSKQLTTAANQQLHKNEKDYPTRKAKPSQLTVAARARAKHAHRGGSNSYFGVATGPESTQNEDAQKLIQQLLDECVWINIHLFGGMNRSPVVEIRNANGYGARWAAEWEETNGALVPDSVVFRGFLEPQQEDGHKLKWRHS